MPSKYVCPMCNSSKIGKQDGEDDYCCDDCLEFFKEPKIISNEKGDDCAMGNRYKSDLDREKIRLLAVDKTVPEISKETGYKVNSIRSAMRAMGLKAKVSHTCKTRKLKSGETQSKTKIIGIKEKPQSLANMKSLDVLIAERNYHQEYVFKLNKAIEILS